MKNAVNSYPAMSLHNFFSHKRICPAANSSAAALGAGGDFAAAFGGAVLSCEFGADARGSRFPEIHLLERLHALPGVALALACYALDGTNGALWGF